MFERIPQGLLVELGRRRAIVGAPDVGAGGGKLVECGRTGPARRRAIEAARIASIFGLRKFPFRPSSLSGDRSEDFVSGGNLRTSLPKQGGNRAIRRQIDPVPRWPARSIRFNGPGKPIAQNASDYRLHHIVGHYRVVVREERPVPPRGGFRRFDQLRISPALGQYLPSRIVRFGRNYALVGDPKVVSVRRNPRERSVADIARHEVSAREAMLFGVSQTGISLKRPSRLQASPSSGSHLLSATRSRPEIS